LRNPRLVIARYRQRSDAARILSDHYGIPFVLSMRQEHCEAPNVGDEDERTYAGFFGWHTCIWPSE